ncbi:hypothetical protein [Haloferax mucosum]|nr:hypothetical protein [Haloferax mucosum]
MVSRTATVLAALVLLSGLSIVAGAVIDSPPKLTVENDDNTTYRVKAYTVESAERAMVTNFMVTTEDGERRRATLSRLVWPGEFRNVTLADEGVPRQQITVEHGETVTTTVEAWTPGNVTFYIVEDLKNNESHVYTRVKTCTKREQEHNMHFEESISGSSTCSSSMGWLFTSESLTI